MIMIETQALKVYKILMMKICIQSVIQRSENPFQSEFIFSNKRSVLDQQIIEQRSANATNVNVTVGSF